MVTSIQYPHWKGDRNECPVRNCRESLSGTIFEAARSASGRSVHFSSWGGRPEKGAGESTRHPRRRHGIVKEGGSALRLQRRKTKETTRASYEKREREREKVPRIAPPNANNDARAARERANREGAGRKPYDQPVQAGIHVGGKSSEQRTTTTTLRRRFCASAWKRDPRCSSREEASSAPGCLLPPPS